MSFNSSGANSSDTAKSAKGKKTVAGTSATLVESNPSRVELIVCNPSSKEVWLALGATAAKEEGIWLKKESGAVVIAGYSGAVSCVTTEGEGSITFAEI